MSELANTEPPVVFLSYSHDSDEHKEWVVQLACELQKAGIEIRFDEWDTGPGDDLLKYMEKSVAESDRVIMVCTESYVRKVNEGEGGAGYEAMVVTGELIKNQATRKFIPIIRQPGGNNDVPRCVSTRRYINFSDDKDWSKSWEDLVRNLHESPKLKRPPLGENPFPEDDNKETRIGRGDASEDTSITSIFEKALRLAQSDNVLEWRRLVEEAKAKSVADLLAWKEAESSNLPQNDADLSPYMLAAVSTYAPIFAVAIAGVLSGEEKYAKQVGLIDWILDPPDWEVSGRAEINMIPELIVFAYQAVLGAAALHSEQPKLAFDLANARVRRPWDPPGESILLFKSTKFIGWPTSMKRHCSLAWVFLQKLLTEWDWLSKAFGSDVVLSAVHAHYLFLNFLDFVSSTKRIEQDGNLGEARGPLYVGVAEDSVKASAYSALLLSGDFLKELIEKNGITQDEFEGLWPAWIEQSNHWVQEVCKSHRGDELPHKFLCRDLTSRGGDLTIE